MTRPPAKIVYFAPGDVLIPRVSRQCIMRFCEAMTACGAEVELVALGIRLEHPEPTASRSLWDVYGIDHRFRIRQLPTLLRQDSSSRLIGAHRFVSYAAHSMRRLATDQSLRRGRTTFYFRNYRSVAPLFLLRRLLGGRIRLVLEVHTPIEERHRRLLFGLDGVVCISAALAEDITERFGLPRERVFVAHTGVNLDRVERVRVSKEEARRRLGIPPGPLVVYTGKVHQHSREVDLLLQAARQLPETMTLMIVGGRGDQVEALRARVDREGPPNVRLTGFVAPADVHSYQFAGDVLVSYYPADIAFNDYRSPAKLFEYLASGNPVVAADYRSTREIVTPDVGVLVPPERPDRLAVALTELLTDPDRASALGQAGHASVAAHTWTNRAARVLEFIESLPA